MSAQKLTPLMEQYFRIREEHPDKLLLFQVGDFYEIFFDQAKKAAAALGIALTKRGTHKGEPIPLCGVPIHALDHYLIKLVKAGFHVAICNQLEEAKPGTVVKRGVTQVLTPATLTDAKLLDEKRASYLSSLFVSHNTIGMVFGELLTGQLSATLVKVDNVRALETELYKFMPDEILIGGNVSCSRWRQWLIQSGFVVSDPITGEDGFNQWFEIFAQKEKIEKIPTLVAAFEQFYSYLKKNHEAALEQFKNIQSYQTQDFLIIDAATQHNLELIRNNQDGSGAHTLFSVLDQAVTAMGSRMIKKWILNPLVRKNQIDHRLDAVETLSRHIELTERLVEYLGRVGDLERIIGRISLKRAHLHDYLHLCAALSVAPMISKALTRHTKSSLLQRICEALGPFNGLENLLKSALNDDRSQDWIIKSGFDQQLDELRDVLLNAHQKVVAMEREEQERIGISSLKIRYNQVQGYYIEVTKPNLHLVPDDYQRHQTLVNKERFVTAPLRELENQLLKARNEINIIEQQVFDRVKEDVLQHMSSLRTYAYALANLDALIGFARTAYDHGYCRPVHHEDREMKIIKGKHPVVGAVLGSMFISNDTHLTNQQYFWILTGPNMGGKSTYLRQVALICLMAQCGSFVPAESAGLPVLDRIFTRVGAGDSLAEGKSTFLVEMEETATICTQATERSLVILDEVGRGTSTYDGLAIAQAVVEFLYHRVKANCLFATHYHELTQLANDLPGIVNFHAASKQRTSGVLFLHKIIPGAAEGSFGLEVAKLAKLPPELIARAKDILKGLLSDKGMHYVPAQSETNVESRSSGDDLLKRRLNEIDLNEISPRQAQEFLWDLKNEFQAE